MGNRENCLLLSDRQGFALTAAPLTRKEESEVLSAIRSRCPLLHNSVETLLIVPSEISASNFCKKAVLTVFPTTNCNLRCSYCYASSGSGQKDLSFGLFQRIVQDVLNPVRYNKLELHLHGGGEPTLNPMLFHSIVTEFAARCRVCYTQASFRLTTNGTFGALVRRTIEEFRIACTVSWDGPDDIQHRQRPFAVGGNSHPVVLANLRHLVRADLLRGIRITVTPYSIERLPEIIRFLHTEGVSSVHIEPVSILGRQKEQNEQGIEVERYAHYFQRAYILCCQLGMDLQGAGMLIFRRPTGRYCGAFGWNFVVTPWGEISACTRIQQQSDEQAKFFLLGPWIPGADPLSFGRSKRQKLRQRCAENLTECSDCYLRYHCAGGCPMSMPGSYDAGMRRTDDLPCELASRCCGSVLSAVRQGYLPPGWERLQRNT